MVSIRSFSKEEGAEVRKFILTCLKERGPLTTEQLCKLVEEAFPKVDYVSTVYHITRDLLSERVIVCKECYEIRG